MILEQPFVARQIPVGEHEHLSIEIAVVRDEDSVWWVLRDVPAPFGTRPRVLPTFFAYAATHLCLEWRYMRKLPQPSCLVHCTYTLAAGEAPAVKWVFRVMPQAPDGIPLEGLSGRDLAPPEADALSEALRLSEVPRRMPL